MVGKCQACEPQSAHISTDERKLMLIIVPMMSMGFQKSMPKVIGNQTAIVYFQSLLIGCESNI